MLTPLLRLAIIALIFPVLTSCQTPSRGLSSEIKEAVKPLEDQRVALLIEFCRGQTPEQITRAEFDSWPAAAKSYVTNNAAQFLAAGCKA